MRASQSSGHAQRRRAPRTSSSTLAAVAAILAIARLPTTDAAYTPLKTYSGSSFFDAWDFYGASSVSGATSGFRSGYRASLD